MSLKGVAQRTLQILERGHYTSPGGVTRSIGQTQAAAEANTRLYEPAEVAELLAQPGEPAGGAPVIEVRAVRTQVAARALVQDEGVEELVLLNFASARNPGGGFINGAKAQEEDLARCSGLYPCQLTCPAYYERNRAESSLLYTDHLIYSPRVPFFRERSRSLLERPFLASVITAPAPNAGQYLRREPEGLAHVEEALRRRAGYVLAIARDQGHRALLLGAWGCGVFGNQPAMVADAFGAWLESEAFAGAFDQVVFAIYETRRRARTLESFQARFEAD